VHLEVISKVPAGAHKTPLLFIHGAWHGAWCWDEHYLDFFADHGFAAHAVSLRGHGASAGRDRLRWTRIREYVADVAQAAASLPASPALIGHSMGGFVAQKYLEQHKAPAAVLLAAVPPGGVSRTSLRLAARHPVRFLWSNLGFSMYPMVATPKLAREAFFSEDLPEAEVRAYWSHLQDESWAAFMDMLFRDLPRPVKAAPPMLVLGAEDDVIFYRDQVEATARRYGTRAEWLPGVAHDAMVDTRWRLGAEKMLAWFRATL
jgi:pimeloyl-ACP methyl ester carboxylesterase